MDSGRYQIMNKAATLTPTPDWQRLLTPMTRCRRGKSTVKRSRLHGPCESCCRTSKTQYDEQLVHQFIKCMGVYPTGTLVRLNTDMLAVVMEQNQESRLEPDVKVMYNGKNIGLRAAIHAQTQLGNGLLKRFGYEDPRAHKINITDFMPNDEDFLACPAFSVVGEPEAGCLLKDRAGSHSPGNAPHRSKENSKVNTRPEHGAPCISPDTQAFQYDGLIQPLQIRCSHRLRTAVAWS